MEPALVPGPGTINWSDINNYNLLGGIDTADTTTVPMSSATNDAVALQITSVSSGLGAILNNQVIQAVEYWASGTNAPTGTVNLIMWDDTGAEKCRLDAPLDATNYAAGTPGVHHYYIDLQYTMWVMQNGYRIGFEYLDPSGSDQVNIQRSNSNVDSSVAISTRPFGGDEGDWVQDTAHDLKIKFYVPKDFSDDSGNPGGPVDTSPIFPVPPSHGMKDYGGPKLTSATYHFIFWTAAWNTLTSPYSRTQLSSGLQDVINSHYFDRLIQHGIKRPKMGKVVTNINFSLPSGGYTRSMIWDFVNDCITRGLVPDNAPGEQNVYLVFAPSGAKDAETGLTATGAYHDYSPWPYNATSHMHPMALMTFQSTLDQAIANCVHEMVEVISDPYYGANWGITGDINVFTPFDGGTYIGYIENCDVCIPAEVVDLPRIAGHRVAYYWSNQDNRCVANTPPTWVSCHIGARWDPEKQECVKIPGTGGGPVDTSMILASPLSDIVIDYGGWKWSGQQRI